MNHGLSTPRLKAPTWRLGCLVLNIFVAAFFVAPSRKVTAQTQNGEHDAVASDGSLSESVPTGKRSSGGSTAEPGMGGGSFADFQSLIDLIQSTVVPDTWEALGGPSTMAPYPQGIYVDPSGTLLDCQPRDQTSSENQPIPLLPPGDLNSNPNTRFTDDAWKRPSRMRYVSLKRLSSQWNQWQRSGRSPSEAMRNMAGISQVQAVFFDENDIILAGSVHGITQHQGWFRDQATFQNTLQLNFLRVALWSSMNRRPFGCTIDPTRDGLRAAAQVGHKIQRQQIPLADAKDALITALGMQRVEVFGIPGDTPIGYIMVEADRHMKQLALGQHPMPVDTKNYLDAIDESISQGPPQDLLLRLWFTAQAREVLTDESRSSFEIRGRPIRLSSENERAQSNGNRGAITRDTRTESFVESFNTHWREICEQYAIYGAAESIYEAASIAELITRFGSSPEHARIADLLANTATTSQAILPTPRQVASIGTLHTVRHQNKRHHILMASGGVMVNTANSLNEVIVDYPLGARLRDNERDRPRILQSWWWDTPETPSSTQPNP